MSENMGKKITFYRLIEENKVVIPKIQRDYVQGRESLRIIHNREKFIKSLVDAVVDNVDMNLNFIYGYNDKTTNFIPIDGQQRLTTLLLLHAYVFACADDTEKLKKLQERFSYETRNTSERFFEHLLKNFCQICKVPDELPKESEEDILKKLHQLENDEFSSDKLKGIAQLKLNLEEIQLKQISKRVENSSWFATKWKLDPTVNSALTVLDTIENNFRFKECDFKRLAEKMTEKSFPISFMLLTINKLGKPEELYIKMNARGKQLTEFENFKADLYSKLTHKSYSDFKNKMDGDWLVLIWNIIGNDEIAFNEADSVYRSILHWIFTSRLAEIYNGGQIGKKAQRNKHDEWQKKKSNIYNLIGMAEDISLEKALENYNNQQSDVSKMIKETCIIEDCYVDDYFKGSENNFEKCINDIQRIFDLLCWLDNNKLQIMDDIKKTVFGSLLSQSGKMSYPERVLMFVLIKYAKKCEKDKAEYTAEQFLTWWYFFRNLINNTVIDKDSRFCDALRAIENFDGNINSDDILKVDFFDKRQLAEEYLKLRLIETNSAWKDVIRKIETKQKYFDGQIYFSFKLICDNICFLETENDGFDKSIKSIQENVESIKIEDFNDVWSRIGHFFGEKGLLDTMENEYLFHRGLLTFGDYSMEITDDGDIKYTFFFEGGKNYYNWRRMLRTEKSFNVFKDMLDTYKSNSTSTLLATEFIKDLIKKEEQKCDFSNTENNLSEEMRHYLIVLPGLFDFMSQNRFAWDNGRNRIILYSGATLQAKYAEIKTYILKLLLSEHNDVEYIYGQGSLYNVEKSNAYLMVSNNLTVELTKDDQGIKFNDVSYSKICDAYNKIKEILKS